MASRWTDVERVEQGALPTMLAQAVIAGTALTVGAIACSGFYLSMIGNVAALLPWATIVILIAVAFTYIVGFALLWCAEALTLRANDKLKPWLYGVVGLIGYGVWGMFVMSAMMNTLNQPLNGVVLSNGDVMALTVNYAVFGFIAFLLAQAYAPKIATKKGLTIGLMVVQIVLAIIGIIVLVMMFSALSDLSLAGMTRAAIIAQGESDSGRWAGIRYRDGMTPGNTGMPNQQGRRSQMFSVLDMFTIGVGPSSSHTVGPMVAAHAFASSLQADHLVDRTARVKITLYGSLALTGLGHGTDRAAMAGLEGNLPATVDTDHMMHIREICALDDTLNLAGLKRIHFDYDRDVVFEQWKRMAAHPNGMRFQAFDAAASLVDEQVWYSIGGGFVRKGAPEDPMIGIHERPPEGASFADADESSSTDFGVEAPYPFSSCTELVSLCREHHLSIAELVWANETASRSGIQVRSDIDAIWRVMRACVDHGCTSAEPTLPGGLDVPRRAPKMYRRLASNSDVLRRDSRRKDAVLESSDAAWVDLFALAVSEENAGGGRIVTAPTNGSAGIIPAVLHYYWHFVDNANEQGVVTFLLTAGAIGYLFKRNASISGAEVGCQGEVGSACSMAAAGLAAVVGGTPEQVENAAEIGIEHNLGLTCDPVGGLVQIPCIERNAMAANTAINAVRMAMLGDGSHIVTLDQAIETMKQTGEDMMAKYKETSKGGLAVNVVEC